MASELGVQTIQHTNGTDALTIGSDGVVTAASYIKQSGLPAFMAQKTDDNTYTSLNTNITFNNTITSHSAWDGTTFTAPIAGVYRFAISGHVQTQFATAMELTILQNGTAKGKYYVYNSSTDRARVAGEVVLSMASGDTVTAQMSQGGDMYAGVGSGVIFCGHFIG